MAGRKLLSAGVAFILVTMTIPAHGGLAGRYRFLLQHGHGMGGHGMGAHGGTFGHHGTFLRGAGFGFGVGGFYYAYSPIFVLGPGGYMPPPTMMDPGLAGPGPLLPPPPPGVVAAQLGGNLRRANFKRGDAARAGQLVTIGDRLFRAGNLKKAEERYHQALRTAPDLAAPRVRLAQVALARSNYADAASRLRDAETAEPGWLITAPDIQALYGEPNEFARTISRLEAHLQAHPGDRDAWLVLGAEWFLSGRTAKAADVFKRLNDPRRRPDVALAAFLDASNQSGEEPANPQ
jgi:hypothetical protein